MTKADSLAAQGHVPSLHRADNDTGIGGRVMYTLLAAIWVALVASPAFADRYYTWNANVPGGPISGGGSSGGTKYYTYEEALNGLKAFAWKGGMFWQNADPSLNWDLNPVFNSLVPHRGYWDTRQTLGPTPTGTCSAAPFYPTCTYVAPPERFAPALFNDVWTCKGICQSPTGPFQAPLGQVYPYCGDFPGYSWSEYGNLNYYQQVAPSGTCFSGFAGAINAVEFDPRKSCEEPCLGNPINPALGTKTHRESILRTADASQPLAFEWLYSSHMLTTKVKRAGWSHTYSRLIVVAPGTTPANMKVNVFRETGVIIAFNLSAGQYAASGDIAHKLARLDDGAGNTTGWTFTNAANDEMETYDGGGRLVAIRTRAGATPQSPPTRGRCSRWLAAPPVRSSR